MPIAPLSTKYTIDVALTANQSIAALSALLDQKRSSLGAGITFRLVAEDLKNLPEPGGIHEVAQLGVTECVVVPKIQLSKSVGDDGLLLANFLTWLRDCYSLGIKVSWRAAPCSQEVVHDLVHLPPPESTAEAGPLRWWIENHRYGLFYWRLGPGFMTLKDVRPERENARYVVDDQATLSALQACVTPQRITSLHSIASGSGLHECFEAGILYTTGGWAMTLPYRVKRWPVPYTAI